jgi:hypothetical protein
MSSHESLKIEFTIFERSIGRLCRNTACCINHLASLGKVVAATISGWGIRLSLSAICPGLGSGRRSRSHGEGNVEYMDIKVVSLEIGSDIDKLLTRRVGAKIKLYR